MQRVTRTFCLLILTLSGPVQAADLNDLVVMVSRGAADKSDNPVRGAGILIHQSGERTIVVTAHHNLPPESHRNPASPLFRDQKVYVEFSSARAQEFAAQILAEDVALDLAVLEVDRVPVSPRLFEATRHVLIPKGAEVVLEHGGFTIGNPRGDHWTKSETTSSIHEKPKEGEAAELRFPLSVIETGMSGGALFSIHGALLGMVLRILPGEGGTALSIGTIARRLEDWKIPFSLDENPEVIQSASHRVLADLGLASEVGLRNALKETTPDFGLLHLFWLAGLEEEVKTALGGLVEGSQAAFTSQVFDRLGKLEDCRLPGGSSPQYRTGIPPSGRRPLSQAESDLVLASLKRLSLGEGSGRSCSAQLRVWIKGLVQSGLDPDLIVANSYYRREALLAVAMRSKNVPAMLALLSSGASPHPYQDLSGTEHMNTRLLAPLRYVLQDFVGAEQDELRKAFLSAGLVVSNSIRNRDFNEYRASEALGGLPATPNLAETESDPICLRASARYAFDWCRYLRELGAAIRFKTGTQDCDSSGYCPAKLTHTLFVGKDRAVLLADRWHVFSKNSRKPVVVEVTRESGQWYAWEHGDNYGCIPRDDGFEPSYCWRRYAAFPASFQAMEKRAEPERTQAASTPSVLDHLEVEGISLSTPLPKALATLEAAGYTTKTVAGPGSHRNVMTTRDYTRRSGDKARQLKVIAMNDSIRTLSFRVYGEKDPEAGFRPPAVGDTGFLFYETDKWEDGSEILAVEASGIGKSFLRYRKSTTSYRSVEIDLLRRAEDETTPEQAFYERWLDEWLGRVEVPPSSQGPCIDRYAHLRGPKGNGCQTPKERAASYLEKVRTGANIRQLMSGLSYEVLVQGQGPRPTPDSSIVAYIVFKYLDGARRDDPLNNWEIVVREIEWPDVKEALLSMKEGDKWRIYVPPGVGSNDSRYLQLTEIQLTSVGGH